MSATLTPAKPSNLSRASIESIAEAISRQVGYTADQSLTATVAKFGGSLMIRDYSESQEDGSIVINGESDFAVFLPTHTSPLRDRFTVAHELGHYILHYLWAKRTNPNIGRIYATRYGSDRTEWEANWFASAFLMPTAEIGEFFRSAHYSFADVAARFSVSTSAASIRLKRLGLIGERHASHDKASA